MPLRIVHLEDDPFDRELVEHALHGDGIDCTIVPAPSRQSFEEALAEPPDLILSDMSLPDFDGIAAQQLAMWRWPLVPFLYVSGSMGEESAIERLRGGATDYVLKHRLEKLPTAVRRAVREAEDRRRRETAENALRQLNAELEARVTERTEALTRANLALVRARLDADRANLAKSEFLSRMSHDLRTPLNAIIGFAQVLEMDATSGEQQEGLTHILRAGRHLLEMINEVLDISRIEAGRLSLSLEPVSLGELVHSAVELVQPLSARRNLSMTVDVPPGVHVLADRLRLNQVLFNLLSNAVKYNREGGIVRVEAETVETHVLVVVSDTGAGIPPDKLDRLFTPFDRLGAEQSGVEGTGLGLALVKGLVQAMNGSTHVESVVGQGSRFTVRLPAADAAALPPDDDAAERSVRPDSGVSGTVLYVEDNPSNVRLMQVVLSKRPGITMLHAPDGETGLAMLRERRPDLVFLDLHLPKIGGEEVLRRVWDDPVLRRIPVVVLTADATPAQMRRLLASGATAYLTKPVDVRDVFAILDLVLNPPRQEFPET
jgi:signal transduction histidine kinase/ActR/RegA family two-component response regulator